jgi:hypothetical protein
VPPLLGIHLGGSTSCVLFIYLFIFHSFGCFVVSSTEWTKKCLKKFRKKSSTWTMRNAVDPAKRALERTRIEREMLNFRPGVELVLPAHRTD